LALIRIRCACDVPSHCYTWSFEPKTDWSANYATSREIHQYFNDFAKKYNLDRYITVETQVVGATWDEKIAEWNVQVLNIKTGVVSHHSAQYVHGKQESPKENGPMSCGAFELLFDQC
jgi:cyclohexanone monooxygenase